MLRVGPALRVGGRRLRLELVGELVGQVHFGSTKKSCCVAYVEGLRDLKGAPLPSLDEGPLSVKIVRVIARQVLVMLKGPARREAIILSGLTVRLITAFLALLINY